MDELEKPVIVRNSKTGKKQKNLYLSNQARQLLSIFSEKMGVSETAVVELLIRDKAQRENTVLPDSGESVHS